MLQQITRSVDTRRTFSPIQKPSPVVRVPPLVSSTKHGERYERSANVDAEICEVLCFPQSDWPAKAKDLRNETLVFFIRRTHRVDDDVCGKLLKELKKRIANRARPFTKSIRGVAKEWCVSQVEMAILADVLTKEPCRKSEYLEIAFAHAIETLIKDEIRKHNSSALGNRAESVDECTDEDGEEIQPIDLLLDNGPGPEITLLNLQEEKRGHQLLQKALAAVEDPRHMAAAIRHYGHGEPITSKQRGKISLARRFRQPPRKVKYWLATAMGQMRAALGIEK